MSPVARNTVFGVPTRSDTNQAVQPQEMVRCQEFKIFKVEGLYYLHVCTCGENKRADQLRLCLRIYEGVSKSSCTNAISF